MKKLLKKLYKKCRKLFDAALQLARSLGKPTCIFLGCVIAFIITAIIVMIAVTSARKKAAQAAVSTVSVSVEASAGEGEEASTQDTEEEVTGELEGEESTASADPEPTAEPTPEPTPVIRYERGDTDDEILNIQSRLMELGYLDNDEPTDFFGPATESAVLLFQRQHGLKEDGIIGNNTYTLLFSKDAKKYVMYEGEQGQDIRAFQQSLADLGYLTSDQVTGYYGTDTVAAVTAFQKRNGLTQDGKAGEKTIEAINDDDARPSAEYEAAIAEEKKKAAEEAKKNSADTRIATFISIASKQIGKPYILGDSGPDSFDCSGLVYYCLRKAGVYVRRMNAAGYSRVSSWEKITSMSKLKKGDLIFFKSDHSNSVSHVGIYLGGGMMIDASTSNGKVVKRSCTGSWSKRNFVCGRRPIS